MAGKSLQAFITGLTGDMPILPAMAWWRTVSCRMAELFESKSDTHSGEHGLRPVAIPSSLSCPWPRAGSTRSRDIEPDPRAGRTQRGRAESAPAARLGARRFVFPDRNPIPPESLWKNQMKSLRENEI